ncbi:MAG: sodium:proton antiporter [Acetobacteraceae bacterium]|nr:sodium:proton antiporter [Acetobacteraceae bacterium]
MSLFDLVTLLLGLSALLGWVNFRFIGLPSSIGMLVMGLVASLLLVAVDLAAPSEPLHRQVAAAVATIDFAEAVMDGMLAFLLFAGALHLDFSALRGRAWPVAVMATAGVVISTAVIGVGIWQLSGFVGVPIALPWALVFGALVSPTDPVAVLGILAAVRVPKALETDMKGESLFNDGVGVVVFSLLLGVAVGAQTGVAEVASLFVHEAVGGVVVGLVMGTIVVQMTRQVDDYALEVMLSVALAAGTYALGRALHTSGPIAVVVAGLLLGNRGARVGMSASTRRHVFSFWDVVDYALNALLFLLIGLEVLVLRVDAGFAWLGAIAVVLALAGRAAAVGISVTLVRRWVDMVPGTIAVLTWGGLRGGISIALVLSLPEVAEKPALLAATYAVALFTLLVQGSTLGWVARRVTRPAAAGG